MASNSVGDVFKITTWGESHGRAIGVVIDGCPAGLALDEDHINAALAARAPGNSPYTSPRKEPDQAQLASGVFEGKTTGAPISIIIANKDADPSKYDALKNVLRPGHANYSYLQKYGVFDYRGGGRASARETACRVAAGAVAAKLLAQVGIDIGVYIMAIGTEAATVPEGAEAIAQGLAESAVFCPDRKAEQRMLAALERAMAEGDSLGGVVEFCITGAPAGLGDPVYQKLDAQLAHAIMSLPATKGFEIGEGFAAAQMRGSAHNDSFTGDTPQVTATNHAGGVLGGISTGMPIVGRVAFKPPSSIKKAQATVDLQGQKQDVTLPAGSRHDPCVAIRAVPVVKAMCQLVLADALLKQRCTRLDSAL